MILSGKKIKEEINKILSQEAFEELTVAVSRGSLSKAIGQRKSNIIRLSQLFPSVKIRFVEDQNVDVNSVRVTEEKGNRDVFKIT